MKKNHTPRLRYIIFDEDEGMREIRDIFEIALSGSGKDNYEAMVKSAKSFCRRQIKDCINLISTIIVEYIDANGEQVYSRDVTHEFIKTTERRIHNVYRIDFNLALEKEDPTAADLGVVHEVLGQDGTIRESWFVKTE